MWKSYLVSESYPLVQLQLYNKSNANFKNTNIYTFIHLCKQRLYIHFLALQTH